MSNPICYIPTKGIDDVIATKLGWKPTDQQRGFNPYRVATLRGMYDETHESSPLNINNIDEAVQKLIQFRKQLATINAATINSAGSNLAKSYQSLRKNLTAEERFNRINMIATLFSAIVDDVQKTNPTLPRDLIIQGFKTSDGRNVLGEFAILDKVYDKLMDMQASAMAANTPESKAKAFAINQVLSNWSSLVAFTRMKLRDTEGVKLGNKLEYSNNADPDNFGDNKLSELFDASESKREGWQEMSDAQSAFGSVGQQVRRLLGSLPQYEAVTKIDASGNSQTVVEVQRDDLGFPIMLDPVKCHQSLMELLRGVQTESQLLGKLRRSQQVWLAPVITALENNPQLRTQFLCDFKKGFQPYSILMEDEKQSKNGIKHFKTKVLNRIENLLGGAFMTRISLGEQVNEMNSVYDKEGNVNWKNLQAARKLIKEWLGAGAPLEVPKYYAKGGTQLQRREFLRQASEMLGIEVDADTLDKIMKNSKDVREYTKNLKEAVSYGIDLFLNKEQQEALDKGNYSSLPSMKYKTLVNKKQKKTDSEGKLREKVNKILTLITKNREGLRLESRVRHKDRKGNNISLFSNVNPSYLSDKIDTIQSYVEANDKAGLRTFITNEYLGSSFFQDTDSTILNKWIQELLDCCDPKGPELSETFAAKFTFQRFLGTTDNSFENFTSKQHAIDMLAEYFSDRQINPNADTALYPIFILGDSGVSKYIRAKRYDAQTILDGLYNVYRQEKRRQALVKASNEFLKAPREGIPEGYKTIDNFSKTADEYTSLQFLNDEKYALPENPTEEQVKNVIKQYMADAVAGFKQRLGNLGLLETKEVWDEQAKAKVQKYVYLNQNATPQNIDNVIADYYWNTKFATIEQLQLMTTDPAFYKGTKDLQKRYKEIHAPGTSLSLQARNPFSAEHEKFSEDGIERCIYFDDIDLNAEEMNPEFMDAIAQHYGKDSDIYNAYKKNTLTDGQGYRSLDSYRKVLGMAGKWTKEMEDTYKAIKGLRAKYARGQEIPASELADIAARAVVFQPIKPYMFTHEKLAVNNNDCVLVPVQHKYAEAVLIPELLPAGSKLADIAYYMEDNNIDLVGSTKIVKVGGFGSTNIKGVTNSDELNAAMSKAYVHQLSYSDYRIQTNVPEHINSSQLFGTQVRKLIMANINMNDYHYGTYTDGNDVNLGGKHGTVRMNGRNLVSFYNSLIVANILDSFKKFDGATGNIQKLSERLLQTTINNSRESMDNMLAYALTENDQFAMPLFEGALEHDSAALLFSLFKKMVNKQSIKGGSAVQVSAMGINSYQEDGDLQYVTDGKGNILYAEVEMPWDISYTDPDGNEIPLAFEDYCNTDGTLKMAPDGKTTLLETKLPNALDFLAYRIPTERDYSMINCKIKRFSHKTAGGTIKVPVQGTTIAGFDFDVDKLYSMRNEYRAKKKQSTDKGTDKLLSDIFGQDTSELIEFEEYDYSKSPLENSRAARNNMLIHLIRQRLMDEETFEQRYTPGGFANASNAARVMRELLFGDLDGIITKGSTQTVSQEAPINIYAGTNENADLSNFAERSFTITNVGPEADAPINGTFKTVEGAFQAQKLAYSSLTDSEIEVIRKQLETASGAQARAIGRKISGLDIKAWDRASSSLMKNLLKASFEQNPQAAQRLINTGNATLTHTQDKGKWGKEFPKLLMEVREELGGKKQQTTPTNTSGSTINWSELDRRIAEGEADPEPNYDPSDPMTIITYNQQNQVAGKLIGIFANQNTNHAFASLMKEFMLKQPIEFAGHSYSDLLHAPEGINVDLNVAEFLSASVDAVKDPVLNFLNLNTITADAGAILARIGYTTQEIGMLFNQPIIKEVCEYCFNNSTDVNTAIREVTNRIEGKITESRVTVNPSGDFSINQLAKNILNDRVMRERGNNAMDNPQYAAEQLKVLELFTQITQVASDVSQFVTTSKFTASNAVGSTFGDLYAQQMKVANYVKRFQKNSKGETSLSVTMQVTNMIEKPINDEDRLPLMKDAEYMDSLIDNPFAYEQAMYDMNRRALQALTKYYPYEKTVYRKGRSRLASLTKSGMLDADTINSIHSDMMVYLLAQQEASDFNGDIPKQGKNMTNREYYTNQFSKDLYSELQSNPSMKDLAIFKYMQFQVNDDTGDVSVNIQGIGGLAPYQKDEIRESWADLQRTHPEIARDLFLYNYFKLGFTFSPLAFMNLAPFDVKNSIKVPSQSNSNRTYVDFLNDIMDDKFGINTEHFAIQYILNHLDNKRFVFDAKSKTATDILKPLAYNAGIVRDSFILDISNLAEDGNMFILKSETIDKQTITSFKPVIKIGSDYFVAQSNDPNNFNTVKGSAITYVRMKSLGTTNKSMQYSSEFSNVQENTATPDNFESGNTSQDPTEDAAPIAQLDRSTMIHQLAEEYAKALEAMGMKDDQGESYSVKAVEEMFNNDPNFTDGVLADMVNDLRIACRKDGVLMLDANGNMQKGC